MKEVGGEPEPVVFRFLDKVLIHFSSLGEMKSPKEGAEAILWAIGAPRGEIKPGGFYEPVGRLSRLETKASMRTDLGEELWAWTETELGKWV